MRRLLATLQCDILLQWRNGFYTATAVVLVAWVAILSRLGDWLSGWLLPPLLLGNLVLTTFYFMGGLILLEKGEGTPMAQRVTPLRRGEYLLSKVVTLTGLTLVETLVLAAVAGGGRLALPPLSAGVTLAAALYCLVGFLAVRPFASINEYLLPSGLVVAGLWLPLVAYLIEWRPGVLYLHPLTASLVLIEASLEGSSGWPLAYGLLYGALWVGLLGWWARRVS